MAELASTAGTEPILWQSTKLAQNDADRQTIVANPDGTTTVIRHPQHGHIGSYENRQRVAGSRYANVLTNVGNIVPLVMTNAAADTNSAGQYGQMMRAKAKYLGWFSPGMCPIALIAVGELDPAKVFAKGLLEERTPCERGTHDEARPCPHTLAEIRARRSAHEADQKRRAEEYKSESDKAQAEANANASKMLEQMVAQGASQSAMMAMFADFMKAVMSGGVPVPPNTPPSPPVAAPAPEPAPAPDRLVNYTPPSDVTAVDVPIAKPEKAPKK